MTLTKVCGAWAPNGLQPESDEELLLRAFANFSVLDGVVCGDDCVLLHAPQVVAASDENVPAAHATQGDPALPSSSCCPATQAMHAELPAAAYLPGAHVEQLVEARETLIVPASQS